MAGTSKSPPLPLPSASPWIQPRKKFLIQMSGPPGAGKSTLAKTLAAQMRVKHGLGAVVINHDLIKDFFFDPVVGEILSNSDSGVEEEKGKGNGNGSENGISFTGAAKLSYKLDWILVWDMFDQGQDVVILDSVCNYREAVDNGLGLVSRWNSRNRSEGAMVYVYVECQFGDGDLEALDKRLKERAERGGALRSQRTGVFEAPAGDVAGSDDGTSKTGKEKEAVELFRKWMNPARPMEEDGAIVVVVDSKTMSAEEGVAEILGNLPLGLSG